MHKKPDRIRLISRHSLAYMLCAISELLRHYKEFDPLDLLLIHAIMSANVAGVMSDPELDRKFSGIQAVEPDEVKRGVSRAAISRFLNLPIETIRRRVDRLKKLKILVEGQQGLIVPQANPFKFGNNQRLQTANVALMRKLFRDLKRAGIENFDDV